MRTPSLRRHKASGQGIVTLSDHDHYLGAWPADRRKPPPAVQQEYDRLIAEWLAGGRRPLARAGGPTGAGPTVGEVVVALWPRVEQHYRHADGTPTSEVRDIRDSLRPLRELYSVDAGLCRTVVNQRVRRVVRLFRWAVAEELVPVGAYQALRSVPGLQKGRCEAREAPPVLPAHDAALEAALPHLSPTVAAMARLQRRTGMRPGEVCALRPCDLDTAGTVWLYRPPHHKNAHRGKGRTVAIGPKGIYSRIHEMACKVRDRLLKDPRARLLNASADRFHAGLVSFRAVKGDLKRVKAECDARHIRIRYWEEDERIRVSTHIFTQQTELNAFFDALEQGLRG
jgi:integrase